MTSPAIQSSPPGSRSKTQTLPHLNLAPRDLDAVKGLFICLIVLGHNTLLNSTIPHLFQVLYSFHVFGFLFLPFLFPAKSLNARAILDRAVRYLIPYLLFYALAATLYFVMFRRGQDIGPWATDALLALVVASCRTLDDACGFQLYWFLPTLFTLVLLRGLLPRLPHTLATTLILTLCLLHLFVGLLSEPFKRYLPFGLPIVVYVFPLGMFIGWLWPRIGAKRPATVGLLALLALTACIAAMILWNSAVNLAYLDLYTYRSFPLLAFHDLTAIAAFLAALGLSPFFARLPMLARLGKHSLVIYLAHSLAYQAVLRLALKLHLIPSAPIAQITTGLACVCLTLSLCLLLAEILHRTPRLQRLILPRSLDDWRRPATVSPMA